MRRKQKGFFVLGCLCACLGILVIARHTMKVETRAVPPVKPIRSPPHALLPPGERLFPTEEEMDRLRGFDRWMDSLSRDSGGRRIADSMHRTRPGLFDSARVIREQYRNYRLLK